MGVYDRDGSLLKYKMTAAGLNFFYHKEPHKGRERNVFLRIDYNAFTVFLSSLNSEHRIIFLKDFLIINTIDLLRQK